ncbi:MAG: alpha/beta hydrolase [Flavobacterium sp.]|nr:alpha/beta hydrolase [Flavobacterium sp.]
MPNHKNQLIITQQIPKIIIGIAQFLQAFSPKLATLYAAKLFTTPMRHKMPKRELGMNQNSQQFPLFVPKINKEIVVYQYGSSDKKVLLVHGWSGRGTQLVKIADTLLEQGFMVYSFDAPAHGKSKGNFSIMPEFIASILEMEQKYGPFEYAIGHSLGGMSVLNAIKQNLAVKKAVTIGSGDVIQDIIDDFVKNLKLKPEYGLRLKDHFETKFGGKMDDYSAYKAAQMVQIPVLVIHDQNDGDVSVNSAFHIEKHLTHSELLITEGLGHRKIVGDPAVIETILKFIE